MRLSRPFPLIGILLLSIPILAQQIQTSPTPPIADAQNTKTPSPAPRDPMAISIVNQAISVAGGLQAITAIKDYSATGNMTYYGDQAVQGSVTFIGRGPNQFRLDAKLPTGVRSWSMNKKMWTMKTGNGNVSPIPVFPPINSGNLGIPYRSLAVAMNNPAFGFSYLGVVEIDGRSVHDIRTQLGSPAVGSPVNGTTSDVFIDPTTYQIVQTQDFYPRNAVHILQYSNYQAQGGVLVPFSITEEMWGKQTWTIQLDQVSFNTGLQDSAFVLQ